MAGIAKVFLTLNERLERLVTRVDQLHHARGQSTEISGLVRRIDLMEEQQKKLQDAVDKLVAICEGMGKICEGMKRVLSENKPNLHENRVQVSRRG